MIFSTIESVLHLFRLRILESWEVRSSHDTIFLRFSVTHKESNSLPH